MPESVGNNVRQLQKQIEELTAKLEQEITKREQAEARLRQQEDDFQQMVQAFPFPTFIARYDGEIVVASQAMADHINLPLHKLKRVPTAKFYTDPDKRAEILRDLQVHGKVERRIVDIKTHTGQERVSLLNLRLVNLHDGPALLAGLVDITSMVETQQALRHSEARYRSIFENNHAVMLLIDPESRQIVEANSAACAYYGYPQAVLTRKRIDDINTLSSEEIEQEMQQAKAEERNLFYCSHRLANGEVRDVGPFQDLNYPKDMLN